MEPAGVLYHAGKWMQEKSLPFKEWKHTCMNCGFCLQGILRMKW